MIVGFTGTQHGMTSKQHEAFTNYLYSLPQEFQFHHGDCVGADEEAHDLVREIRPKAEIHIHPPINPKRRARCEGDVVYSEKDYMDRNEVIVSAVDALVATPFKEEGDSPRSGTWATIRRARKAAKPFAVLMP